MSTSVDGTAPPVSTLPAEKTLEAWLTGQNLEPGYTTLNTINSLDAIISLDQKVKAGQVSPAFAKIWENESKFIRRSVEAIHDNDLLKAKFGNTLQSALSLVPFLKEMSARKMYESILEPYAVLQEDKAQIKKKASAFSGST